MKRTSKEWVDLVKTQFPQFEVIDPDGWDRTNYEYSFNEEIITATEFKFRLFQSTIMSGPKVIEWMSTELN